MHDKLQFRVEICKKQKNGALSCKKSKRRFSVCLWDVRLRDLRGLCLRGCAFAGCVFAGCVNLAVRGRMRKFGGGIILCGVFAGVAI